MKILHLFMLTAITVLLFSIFPSIVKTNQEDQMNKKNEAEFVPQWAKEVVWYQIFPDRFRNGDSTNDPTKETLKGSWPHDHTSPWQVHPWASDWYQLQPYESENGKDIWLNIQRRRYGGDIQGIIDKLDYLQELGIGALYLNPLFESPSSHKYDGTMYHHIDPHFGPDPEGDKKLIANEIPDDPSTWVWTKADKLALKLIEEVHKRGMKIIFDGVFNHLGINSPFFQDVVKNQQDSKYKNWFKILSWDNSETGEKFNYQGWYGVRELPELNQDENGIVEGPKEYIFAATKRWMDPYNNGKTESGIDGWRLDVAFCVAHPFWKDWRKLVKLINPEAYLTAEVIEPIDELKPYLLGDEFDAVMNYNFAFTCAEYMIEKKTKINTTEFDKKLKVLRKAFPEGVAYVQQNLFGSHDANRIGSHIVNKNIGGYRDWGKYFPLSKKESNPLYDIRKPNENELRIKKLFVIFQMTYVGAPMVYYGNEAGMWGANDPDCRKPMVWNDMEYDDEEYNPDQSLKTKPDKVFFNKELFEHYKNLIHIRNNSKALQLGDFKAILIDDDNELYGFERNFGDEKIIVVINNNNKDQLIELKEIEVASLYDTLNQIEYKIVNGSVSFTLDKRWGVILKTKKL